jgi:tetratricopeptide (TPR) repeat protein
MDNINIVLTKNSVSVDGDEPTSYRLSRYYQEKLLKNGTLSLDELIAYGYEIFMTIFSTDKRQKFVSKKLNLRDNETLVITIKSDEAEVHNIPFEIINNNNQETGFLLKKGNISILRDMPILDKKIIPAASPIRILILISMPLETYEKNPIDPLRELRIIYDALEEYIALGLVEIDVEEKVNMPTVRGRLLKGHYHMVHFTGHGSEGGYLIIEDEECNERERFLEADELKMLFEGSNVSIFYFDACETAKASMYVPSLAQNIFSGITSACVIANLATVRDDLATESAKFIYKRIFTEESISHVLSDVRVKLTTDWWKPVVYGMAEKKLFAFGEIEKKKRLRKVIYRPPRTIRNYVYRYGIVRQASGMIEDGLKYLVLLGIGGSGKSTLAIYLSEFFEAKFRHVVFIDLRKEKINKSEELIEKVIREFDIEGFIKGKELEKLNVIKQWRLLNEKIDTRWLLIIDNLETVQDEKGVIKDDFQRLLSEILNTGGVFTVFTSRLRPLLSQRLPLENILEIGEYSEGEVAFLFRNMEDDAQQFFDSNYDEIKYRFGNHPLSLSRTVENRDLTLANILNSDDMKETLEFYRIYFEKNRQNIEKLFCLKYPLSKNFLNIIFPADFISLLTDSLFILKHDREHYAPYQVIRSYYEKEFLLSDVTSFKDELLEIVSPSTSNRGTKYPLSFSDLLNIFFVLMEYRKRTADKKISDALLRVFAVLSSQERTHIILPNYLLDAIEEIINEASWTTELAAPLWARLGSVYRARGNYDKAVAFYEKTIKVEEEKFGKEHPETAITYDNLASVYLAKGNHEKAMEFYEKALNIKEDKLGKDHPATATTYNNLILVYKDTGDYDRAIKFGEKALKITEEKLGKDHPDAAATYNNLALVYLTKGDYDKAIEFYEKALKIVEEKLGEDHPNTATAYNNLAEVYRAKGDLASAIKFGKKALKIMEEKLGEDHPLTADSYNHLAGVYKDQGDYDVAIKLYTKALKIREEKSGKDNPSTAVVYNNLAGVYKDKHDYDMAIKLYNKALMIKEDKLGKDHPGTASTYSNLALVYNMKGDYDKAIEFYEKALKIIKDKLGKDHPSIATVYNNLAGVYKHQGDCDKCTEFYEKALKIMKDKLVKDHPDIAATYINLASVYDEKGDVDRAIELYENALNIWKARKDYHEILMVLPFLIYVWSKATSIDYSKVSNYICEFLELYDIATVRKKTEIIGGIDLYFVVKKIFERLSIKELKENIKDRMCIERLNKFLPTSPLK